MEIACCEQILGKKKPLKLFFLVVFLISNLSAISLENAVFQTLSTNPQIIEKAHSLKGVQSERDSVLSAYYPKLDLSVGTGLATQKTTPAFNNQSGAVVTRTDYSITATMNIFNGFNTYHDLASQTYRTDAAKSYLTESKASIAMQTVESFINMVKQKAIVQISKENVSSQIEIYNKLLEYTESGIGKASDLGFASARLSLAKVNEVVNENNFIQSKVIFETLFGAPIEVSKLQEPVFDYVLPSTLDDAAVMALDHNPSIQVGKDNVKSAQSDYKKSQSVYYPSVDIEVKESLLNESGGYEYSVNSSDAMVYLSYNIFNGFADKAAIEKGVSTYLQNNQFILATQRDVIKKLGVAWIAAIKIQEQLQLLDQLTVYSKKTLEDYYKEFGIGRRTLLDIINVKNDYDNARQSYQAAKYDLLLSKFRILDAMGSLLDYFSSKADTMQLTVNEAFVENKSVYEIIKQMNYKIQNKEDSISYDDSNYSSFDTLMQEQKEPKVDESIESAMVEEDFLQEKPKIKEEIVKLDSGNFQEEYCFLVKVKKLNIRKNKDTKSKIIGTLKQGDTVCSKTLGGLWIQSSKGWVSKTYLKYIKKSDTQDEFNFGN